MILLLVSQTFVGEEVVSSRFLEEINRIEKPLYSVSSGDSTLDGLYRSRRFREIIKLYSSRLEPVYRLFVGEAHYYLGDYPGADSLYSLVLRENADTLTKEMALLSKGWTYYRRGLYERSLDIARRVSDTSLEYVARLLEALSSIALKDYFTAYRALEGFETPEALLVRGYATYMLGNYDLVLKALNRLYELYPNSPLAPYALFRIATVYLKTGYVDDAIRYLSLILEEYPNFELRPQAYYILAKTLYQEKRYEELADVVRDFLKEYPESDYVPVIKKYLLDAYSSEPYMVDEDYPYYHLLEGYVNYEKGNCGTAIEHLERYLRSQERRYFIFFRRYSNDPFVPDALLYVSRCYLKLGDEVSAENYLKKCHDYRCRIELSKIHFGRGDYDGVIKLLSRYRDEKLPLEDKAEIYYLLGASYARKGDVEKAKRLLRRAEVIYKEVGNREDIERVRRELKGLE